jgi:uncharacterized membrane protein
MARGRRSLTRADCLIGLVVMLLGAVTLVVCHRRSDPPQSFATVGPGGDVRVPLADVASGQARFIQYLTRDGREVRFFAVRSTDGVTRVALDACEKCYREGRGYRQAGSHMVCNYCQKSYDAASIGDASDGCQPLPLERIMEGNAVIVRAATLERSGSFFH